MGARDSFDRIQGGGGGGGGAGNFTYGDGIRYNIIMRCKPVSYNSDLKGHHEKEIPHEIHQRESQCLPAPHIVVSTDLLRCSDAVARHGVSPVRSGLQGCTGLGGLLPSRCGGDDRQAWSDDRRAVLTNGGFGPLLLEGNGMKPMYTHDCEECTFLGTVLVQGQTTNHARTFGDLWLSCNAGFEGHSRYIIRMSSDGPDYITARPEHLPIIL